MKARSAWVWVSHASGRSRNAPTGG
jgi:hypothetical protein